MGLEAIVSGVSWEMVVLAGISLSVGWGIRGNFGHEYGAAIPGALAAMAVVLVSGRPEWWARAHYFAMFGALGWSFGGSMSYMQVVGFTHSGHPPSVLYGYANLFVIGFLWAFLGGIGTALPAFLTSNDLGVLCVPLIAVFAGWSLQAVVVDRWVRPHRDRRQESPLYWYDTDWLAALVALVATITVIIGRGGLDVATSLFLYLSVGWYAGFLILVNLLKLRMTPPRGDNWSGCVGMAAGAMVFCWRNGLEGVAFVGLVTGILGGVGYAFAQLLKVSCIKTGRDTNWHRVLEQLQGLFHGTALAVGMGCVALWAPRLSLSSSPPAWTGMFAIGFVLLGLTYLNHRKCALTWVEKVDSLTERSHGLPVAGWLRASKGWIGWLELFFLAVGIALFAVLRSHASSPLSLIPGTTIGKAQLLYLVFLWWVVVMNFDRAIVAFTPSRLVTEGVVSLNAVICTALVAILPAGIAVKTLPWSTEADVSGDLLWLGGLGLVVAAVAAVCFWGATHGLFGRQQVPHAGRNVRFGPNATATREKPGAGEKHP
jgi:hypothetical protein